MTKSSFKRIRDLSSQVADSVIPRLTSVYGLIPKTSGCLENISKSKEEDGCLGRCCKRQNPQVLYVEFFNTWRYIFKTWKIEDIFQIVEESLRNYLTNNPIKGCVFFNWDERKCKIYKTRPFNCYLYGITPEKDFNLRLEKLRKEYKNIENAIFEEQCSLVKTNKKVTSEDIDDWWNKLIKIESLLVPKNLINDEADGSYRTFHDHVLLQILHTDTLSDLTQIRMYSDEGEKEKIIKELVEQFKKTIEKQILER